MIPGGDNQAWRWAGGTALAFGAIDVLLAALALPALAREERRFADDAAARRTPAGLDAARHALVKSLNKEAVIYAVNLGLDAMYAAAGVVAIIASQEGVSDHERWLSVGIVLAAEGVFLIGIDTAGLLVARRGHDRLIDLAPQVSLVPTSRGVDAWAGLRDLLELHRHRGDAQPAARSRLAQPAIAGAPQAEPGGEHAVAGDGRDRARDGHALLVALLLRHRRGGSDEGQRGERNTGQGHDQPAHEQPDAGRAGRARVGLFDRIAIGEPQPPRLIGERASGQREQQQDRHPMTHDRRRCAACVPAPTPRNPVATVEFLTPGGDAKPPPRARRAQSTARANSHHRPGSRSHLRLHRRFPRRRPRSTTPASSPPPPPRHAETCTLRWLTQSVGAAQSARAGRAARRSMPTSAAVGIGERQRGVQCVGPTAGAPSSRRCAPGTAPGAADALGSHTPRLAS